MKKEITLAFICLGLLTSCKDYLDVKPNKALLVPTTLEDYQAMLDNISLMNQGPSLNAIGSDDYYTTESGLLSQAAFIRNAYIWAAEIFEGGSSADWLRPYEQVFYANIVINGLGSMDVEGDAKYNGIKGSALFYRAFAFYNLAQNFAKPYDAGSAGADPGIPIRVDPDVNIKAGRGTVQATYDQVLADLMLAETLLPEQVIVKSRPSRAAALALIARVYLTMENYPKAELYAGKCLELANSLLDYNKLNATAARPLPAALPNGNDEVIYYAFITVNTYLPVTTTIVDSALYKSYAANDLRKVVFFNNRGNGIINFKGSYSGPVSGSTIFSGLATDEIYLVRAECYARSGKTAAALSDLNALMLKRWKSGTFIPFTASTSEEALKLILAERRKELVGRGTRWTDLRRLNKDPRFAITLKRLLGQKEYTLSPNDKRYVLPIPDNEVQLASLEQNVR